MSITSRSLLADTICGSGLLTPLQRRSCQSNRVRQSPWRAGSRGNHGCSCVFTPVKGTPHLLRVASRPISSEALRALLPCLRRRTSVRPASIPAALQSQSKCNQATRVNANYRPWLSLVRPCFNWSSRRLRRKLWLDAVIRRPGDGPALAARARIHSIVGPRTVLAAITRISTTHRNRRASQREHRRHFSDSPDSPRLATDTPPWVSPRPSGPSVVP